MALQWQFLVVGLKGSRALEKVFLGGESSIAINTVLVGATQVEDQVGEVGQLVGGLGKQRHVSPAP